MLHLSGTDICTVKTRLFNRYSVHLNFYYITNIVVLLFEFWLDKGQLNSLNIYGNLTFRKHAIFGISKNNNNNNNNNNNEQLDTNIFRVGPEDMLNRHKYIWGLTD